MAYTQERKPEAPIKATPGAPVKNAPEHKPTALSSRFTATCRKRLSASKWQIIGAIQLSGKLATRSAPASLRISATRRATSVAARDGAPSGPVSELVFIPVSFGSNGGDHARTVTGQSSLKCGRDSTALIGAR